MSSKDYEDLSPRQHITSDERRSHEVQHQWTVDQINQQWAKLQSLSDAAVEVDLPCTYLPVGVKEGDILNFNLHIDQRAGTQEKEEISSILSTLSENDDGGDFSL